jgi:DNA-directed RNA polymerase specialized sigma24 family protein
VASGQYELEQPEQLLKLLAAMARNKLASAARRYGADRRDFRRTTAAHQAAMVAPDASPSQQVAAEELLLEAQRRLTPEERQLVDMRRQGRDWATIARELGNNPVLLRKKLSRALDRVTQQLGLNE